MRLQAWNFILVQFIVLFVKFSNASLPGSITSSTQTKPSRRLAPCQACRTLVNSFQLVSIFEIWIDF